MPRLSPSGAKSRSKLIRSEWISGTPKVIGRHFTVDLGTDRAIVRVRVLAGGTALNQPESFMRGYRLQAATQANPDFWRLLAEERANLELNVDTEVDSTWRVFDAEGEPLSRTGRFVRLELIGQDRSNWVSIGEIEVFGTGFAREGIIEGEFSASRPVNVGRVRWQAQTPPRAELGMRFRGADDGQLWPEWEAEEGNAASQILFGGSEPVTRFQYQGTLQTETPFSTPALRRIEVEYDPVLVAREVSGKIFPDTVRKGEEGALTYTAAIEVGGDDYGVDQMRLDGVSLTIDEVRLDGGSLPYDENLERGYRWRAIPAEDRTLIEFASQERIEGRVAVEIVGRGLFLQDWIPVQLQVASREQAARDGFVNWQNAERVHVRALGLPSGLLDEIQVSPSPFSPFRDGNVDFRFIVGNIRENADIAVEVFKLDGRRVRRLVQEGRARAYHFAWDGRDRDEKIVAPGLYLYEIRVEAGDSNARRQGALVVAY